jgi:ankyrin
VHYLVRHNTLDEGVLKKMLEKGASIDIQDKYGETPLHHAAARNKLVIVETLLKHKANPNATTRFGETPLHKGSEFLSSSWSLSAVDNHEQ